MGTNTFEAKIDQFALPLDLVLYLKLPEKSGEPNRFDFTFRKLSTEDAVTEDETPRTATPQVDIPASRADILAALLERRERIAKLLRDGEFPELYLPALEGKEFALAYEERSQELPAAARGAIARATVKIVRGAWLLDESGDSGNRKRAEESFALFSAGVEEMGGAAKKRTADKR